MIPKIRKRDGRVVDFDNNKVFQAIWKAAQAVGGEDQERAKVLADMVIHTIENKQIEGIPSVEQIQDVVEKVLVEHGHTKTAKSFILYRQKRKELREAKSLLGLNDDESKLSLNALKVLEGRYLQKDQQGNLIENPKEMFERVARNVAQAEIKFQGNPEETEKEFYELITSGYFLPNSPTLMNAGTKIQQLSACFVLPIDDNIPSIFEAVKNTAIIHQSGGGTGFSFNRIRPKGDPVGTTGGIASGPISFLKVFDAATEQIKQGGKRRGANMGILRVDHPDILDFITAKERNDSINNFNLSVAMTDKFMDAVENDTTYDLINPATKEVVTSPRARRVFDLICTMAWKNGEPGVIFIDKINKYNPTPHIGELESTNPCGEQPLLPFESCNLGSINLSNLVKEKQFNWEKFKEVIHTATHFLDNVIEMNQYPLADIDRMTKANRKIGLGVMGFADMLIKLRISYGSSESVELAEKIMSTIDQESKVASYNLAKVRGTYPNFPGSSHDDGQEQHRYRNATTTTIAPTGSISVIASCSSGIEPLFAISYIRKTPQFELMEVNPLFEEVARAEGFYTEDLVKHVAKRGSVQGMEEIPENIRNIFVTSMDLTPEQHIKMQATFQKHVDNAVSKTVNFPFSATVEEVAEVYKMAYDSGCKGTTIYRDGSRDVQVLNVTRNPKETKEPKKDPIEKTDEGITVGEEYAGGCTTCNL